MANKEIADLAVADPITGGESLHVVQSGNSRDAKSSSIAGVGYATKSASYTVLASDFGNAIICTAAITLSLTAAATLGSRWFCRVQAKGGDVTIDPNGSETIDGEATLVLPQGANAIVFCDGTNLYSVASANRVVVQNHVTSAVNYGSTTDRHIVALDTDFTTTRDSQDILISAVISAESEPNAVLYMKIDGVEVGSAPAAGNRTVGLVSITDDSTSTIHQTSIQYKATIATAGTYTVSFHVRRSTSDTFALNRTETDSNSGVFERATSNVIIEVLP